MRCKKSRGGGRANTAHARRSPLQRMECSCGAAMRAAFDIMLFAPGNLLLNFLLLQPFRRALRTNLQENTTLQSQLRCASSPYTGEPNLQRFFTLRSNLLVDLLLFAPKRSYFQSETTWKPPLCKGRGTTVGGGRVVCFTVYSSQFAREYNPSVTTAL